MCNNLCVWWILGKITCKGMACRGDTRSASVCWTGNRVRWKEAAFGALLAGVTSKFLSSPGGLERKGSSWDARRMGGSEGMR